MSSDPSDYVTSLRGVGASEDVVAQLDTRVYGELCELARSVLPRGARPLQTVELVNEAYLRLVGDADVGRQGRRYFFGSAARAMHRILVEHARRLAAKKRQGGPRITISVSEMPNEATDADVADVMALSDALAELAEKAPRKHQIVELRYFAGLSVRQTAELLGVSETTVKDDWAFARAWLATRLGAGHD